MAKRCAECKMNNEFAAKLHAENQTLRAQYDTLLKQVNEARAQTVDANMRVTNCEDAVALMSREMAKASTSHPLTFDQIVALVRAVGGKETP